MPQSIPPPDALLCERCGYPIAGLAATRPCPECALPAAESWPTGRPGSRVQRNPGLAGGWFWTNIDVLRSPRAVFRRLRIDPRSSARFFATNIGVVAVANVIGFSFAARRFWLEPSFFLLVGIAAGLLLLTWIETVGLRFFARAQARRWRVTPAVAWTVAHHASVGWLVGGLLMLLVWVTDPAGRLLDAQWAHTLINRRSGGTVSDYSGYIQMAQVAAPPLIGLLMFESLVFLGVRQCRYANTPASEAEQGQSG